MWIAVCTRLGTPSRSSASCRPSPLMTGAQHAHVVGPSAVHAPVLESRPADDVAASDYDGHLYAGRHRVADLTGDEPQRLGVDAERVGPGERLAGELDQHSRVARASG
jgi:hypothetical protein